MWWYPLWHVPYAQLHFHLDFHLTLIELCVAVIKMASGGDIDDGFVRVASFSDLSAQKKICVRVEDRNIALFYVKKSAYAMDLFCYRKNPYSFDACSDACTCNSLVC